MSQHTHRFAFFGTPYVSRDTLEILHSVHGMTPAIVVTSPDAPRGRGLVLTPSETKVWALEHGIPVYTPERIDKPFVDELKVLGCEYAIVVAYGKILPQAAIDAFPRGLLNIHYSLLPMYRGASPVEAALLHGDVETGVSIQKMILELDAGDIVAQESTKIMSDETTIELRERLIKMGADLLAETLPSYLDDSIELMPQDHARATRCRKIKKEDGYISLQHGDDDINWRKYRAYAQWPRVSFEAVKKDGEHIRVIVTKAHFKSGAFVPDMVKPAGKGEMKYEDFLRSGAKPV